MKVVQYYLADRKLWHTKPHIGVLRCAIQAYKYTLLHLVRTYAALLRITVFSLNRDIGSSAILKS